MHTVLGHDGLSYPYEIEIRKLRKRLGVCGLEDDIRQLAIFPK